MTIVLSIIGVMTLVGLFFGVVLALASKKLAVEMNPLVHEVEDALPKGQCGACGYAGCQAYAEAVVNDPTVAPNLCTPGKAAVAEKVSQLTGKVAEKIEPRVAFIKCQNPVSVAPSKYEYSGIDDCVAVSLLHLGSKACKYGCVGKGTCVKHCPFNALTLDAKGLPIVDREKCTGCGKCEMVCPKHTIEMVPVSAHVGVGCSSHDRGAQAKKDCPIACIGCTICVKQCPHQAIHMENNLAVVEHQICMEKCSDKVCVAKCPQKTIYDIEHAHLDVVSFTV